MATTLLAYTGAASKAAHRQPGLEQVRLLVEHHHLQEVEPAWSPGPGRSR
jgi:hypothetical protein